MSQPEDISRIRVRYAKGDALRFTGHLDMQRLWERLLRRSGLPVRYSQGYHPRARLNLASALPLGFLSDCELLDFWMNETLPIEAVHHQLVDASPPGLVIESVEAVDKREESLQSRIQSSAYRVEFYDPQDQAELEAIVNELLSQEEILRTRRKKTYDLRPLILSITVEPSSEGAPSLALLLRNEPAATGRPDEVLAEMGFENTAYLVTRTRIDFD